MPSNQSVITQKYKVTYSHLGKAFDKKTKNFTIKKKRS